MDVICDTSFLIVLVSAPIKRIDQVEREYGKLNFLVPDLVIEELKRLEQISGPKKAMLAKTAITISSSKAKVVKVKGSKHVDDSIIDYALNHNCAVATIDGNLRRRLLENNILVLTLSKNVLRVIGPFKDPDLKFKY
jgi:rRNA-processing protein FCF1